MTRRLKVLALLLLLTATAAHASAVEDQLKAVVHKRYGHSMRYYTIVPYRNKYFAASYDVASDVRNSTGKDTHWAIWECVGGRWSYVFDFHFQGADADESSAKLTRLFNKYQFSGDMRGKLMYGTEKRL